MFFIASLGGFSIAYFYLVNHAFSKCLLFLTAGSIIHSSNNQNPEKLTYLSDSFSETSWFIGVITLTGFPIIGL